MRTVLATDLRSALRWLAMAVFLPLVLAGCGDSDPTPILDQPLARDQALSVMSLTGGPALAGNRSSATLEAGDAAYRLGANDRLRIIVFGQDKLSGEYLLAGDGALAFPLIGQIAASGMTIKELELALAGKLDPDYIANASVSVEVLTRRPFYVLGEVQKPGSYPHTSRLNVLSAVATAGGYTFRARTTTFYIKRSDEQGKLYRIRATPETQVRPGDVVEVMERYF